MTASSGTATEELLSHLRADVELKSELIRALRTEREREEESARDRASLMAAAIAELHERSVALSLLPGETDPSALQRAAGELAAATGEVAEYATAAAGQLTLARAPVNLRQLLRCIESTSALELCVASSVPERVLTDVSRFTRVLCYFVEQCTEAVGSSASALEVSIGTAGADSTRVAVKFVLHHSVAEHSDAPAAAAAGQPMVRLRAALARAVCELMGAQISLTTLILELEIAEDQAQTGRFRLALAEASTDRPPGKWHQIAGSAERGRGDRLAFDARRNDEASIDLLYLDRQLGSLAPLILERTAPAFVAHAQRRMTDLHVAREVEDLKRLRTVAHVWKGSALSVGALGLASLLDGIEKQAAANRSPGPGPIWQVRSMLDRVLRALDRYGDSAGGRYERA